MRKGFKGAFLLFTGEIFHNTFAIVIFPYLQLMYASIVSNQGLPKIRGWLLSFYFVLNTMKSVEYSHEFIHTMISSRIPFGHNVELSTNCKTVVVCLNNGCIFNLSIVSFVITFIVAPRSINVFGIDRLLIFIVIVVLIGSTYLGFKTFQA